MMDIHAILKQLPHRYPFLLVDRVVELERNTRIRAIKNVTFNEPYFTGHFPGRPVDEGEVSPEVHLEAGLLDAVQEVPDIGAVPVDAFILIDFLGHFLNPFFVPS